MHSDGAVYIKTLVDTNEFSAGMESVEKRISKLSNSVIKLGGVIASVFAVRNLVEFGKEAINLGADLQEVQNVVDVTFGNMTDKVDEFAKKAAEAAGLSEIMAKRYVGTFGAMAKAFGFAESESFQMSTALTQLAGDVASFYNITQDEAYTKLKSVFTGETETLKDLGVVMTQSALDSFAMAKGYMKTTKQMSEQEKVALRYAFVMEQLSAAQGDFARTSDSWANQTKILSLNFDKFKANLGKALINIFTPFLKTMNEIVSKIAQLSTYFVAFSEMISGKSTSSGGGSPGDAFEDMSDGYDKVTQSANKAEKAQKKYLSGLDEIKTFTSSDTETSIELPETNDLDFTAADGAASLLEDELKNIDELIADFQERFPKLTDFLQQSFQKIKEIVEDFKNGDFFEMGSDISDLIVGIYNFFAEAINEVNWQGIGNKIGEFLAGIDWLKVITAALKLKFNIWKAIAELWFGAFEKAPFETIFITGFALLNFTSIGKIISSKLLSSMLGAFKETGFISKVVEAFKLAISGAGTLKEAFTAVFGSVGTIISGILAVVSGAVMAVTSFIDMLTEGFNWFDEVIMVLGIALAAVGAVILGAPALIAAAVAAIVAALATAVVLIKDNWDAVTKIFTDFDNFLQKVFAADFAEIFGPVLGSVLTGFQKNAQGVWNGIKKLFTGIITFITGVFSGDWKKAWKGIVDIFGGIFDTLVALAKTPFNLLVGAVNGLISAISSGFNFVAEKMNNLFSLEFPEWVPFVGGESFSIPTIPEFKIPFLATGAVIPPNAPFVAMLGDQKSGNNIEAPEGLIRKIVREETGGNSANGDVTIPVYIDGNKLFEIMISKAQLMKASTGSNLLVEI